MAVVDSLRARGHPKRRFNAIPFHKVYRLVWDHPFLVVSLSFLICLHQYFPSIFSLLVSFSPILVCTLVLLGALLVHGQPNDDHRVVGEKYRGEVSSNTVASVRRGVSDYDSWDCVYCGTPKDTSSLLDYEDRMLAGYPPHDAYSKSEMQSVRSSLSNRLSDEESDYKYMDEDEEEDETSRAENTNNNNSSYNGSRSCGVRPNLDVAAFTLQVTGPIPREAQNNFEENVWMKSAVACTEDDRPKNLPELRSSEMRENEQLESVIARISNERKYEEEEEEEEAGVSEDVDDEDDDDQEEENPEAKEEEEGSKAVTKWTEDDETNLRALGTSELERNQRLENLLAKRRERRNLSMIPEMNLIDLDFVDIPFQIAPISTSRAKINPFDDGNQQHNVPQIPSSAPSITIPRRNPFDSPTHSPEEADTPIENDPIFQTNASSTTEYDPIENDPKNPIFQPNASSTTEYSPIENVSNLDFLVTNPKEAALRRYDSFSSTYNNMVESTVFRRHESFSERRMFPSICSQRKPSRFNLRPVFVPEHLLAREEEDDHLESHGSMHSQSESERSESESESEYSEALENDEDDHLESHGSEAVLENDEDDHLESHGKYTHSESESERSESEREYSEALEIAEDEHLENHGSTHSQTLAIEDKYDTASNTSMSSEDIVMSESVFSPKTLSVESDIKNTSAEEEDHQLAEPVYDRSPSALDKNTLFSSTPTQT